jgi:hypothetical protein
LFLKSKCPQSCITPWIRGHPLQSEFWTILSFLCSRSFDQLLNNPHVIALIASSGSDCGFNAVDLWSCEPVCLGNRDASDFPALLIWWFFFFSPQRIWHNLPYSVSVLTGPM